MKTDTQGEEVVRLNSDQQPFQNKPEVPDNKIKLAALRNEAISNQSEKSKAKAQHFAAATAVKYALETSVRDKQPQLKSAFKKRIVSKSPVLPFAPKKDRVLFRRPERLLASLPKRETKAERKVPTERVVLPKPPKVKKESFIKFPETIRPTTKISQPDVEVKKVESEIKSDVTNDIENTHKSRNIFRANQLEFVGVVVPQKLTDEINSNDAAAVIQEYENEQAPEVIPNILAEGEIQDILSELAVQPVQHPENLLDQNNDQAAETELESEVEELSETAAEFLDFAMLLDLPSLENAEDAESVEILNSMEIIPLPTVCVEVVQVIQNLHETDPELAVAATETLYDISNAVDEVINLRLNGSELAPAAEEELHDLCIKLFTQLGWALEPETIMKFIEGTMQAKQIAQIFTDKMAPLAKQGTHEIKQEHDPVFGGMLQETEDDLTRAIGTHAVRNYQFALA